MNLNGLAAFASQVPQGYLTAEQKQQQLYAERLQAELTRQKLRDAAMARAAQGAATRGLVPNAPGMAQGAAGQPGQQGPGGAPVQAEQPGGQAGQAPPPQSQPPMGGPQPPQQPQRAPPIPTQQPGGAPPGGPGGGTDAALQQAAGRLGGGQGAGQAPQMPAMMTIEQLAERIRKANPEIDDATLFQAIFQAQQLLLPQERQQLQLEMKKMQVDYQTQALTARIDQANDRLKQGEERIALMKQLGEDRLAQGQARLAQSQEAQNTRQMLQNLRAQLLQAQIDGADPKEIQKQRDRLDVLDKRNKDQLAKSGPEAEYKEAATELRAKNDEIDNFLKEPARGGLHPGPGSKDRPEYDKLVSERAAIYQRMVAARKRNPSLPSPAAARGAAGQTPPPSAGGGAQPAPGAQPAAQAPGAKSYPTADDVLKALDSGELGKEEAKKVLIDQFGYTPKGQ